LDGYQDVKLWLIKAITASGRDANMRAGLLTALFEALARSNNPETIERLEKRASIASLSALTASSSSITVPSFVEAVIIDVLLDPIVRLELDVWNIAVKSFIGRPDDLVGILSTARLRYSGETRSASTLDVGKCTGLRRSTRCDESAHHDAVSLAWLMRCLAEIVWSFPESPDFMVNFEKQR
jgi:hypothetical protein